MCNLFKRITLIAILVLLFSRMDAQGFQADDCLNKRELAEIGVMVGTSYYMGDFNPNLIPFKNSSIHGGILYRYNLLRFLSIRANVGMGGLKGNAKGLSGFLYDPWSPDSTPEDSNYWAFYRPWLFVDALAEFNFMPYNAVNAMRKDHFTPVLMIGASMSYLFSDHTYADKTNYFSSDRINKSVLILNIPVGIGIKWCIVNRLTLGAEWLFRITFHDNVDFYTGVNQERSPIISNDWIGTVGLSLAYSIKERKLCPAYNQHKPSTDYLKGRLVK